MDGLNWELMVYRIVKHRGQWPKSSTPLVVSGSELSFPLMVWLLQHKVLRQSARLLSRTLLPQGPCHAYIWSQNSVRSSLAAPCLDHSFSVSLIPSRNGESPSRGRAISSIQSSRAGKDRKYCDCPTKPAGERQGRRSWDWQASAGPS